MSCRWSCSCRCSCVDVGVHADVAGCRPVVVTFEDFNDREQVLRKAGMLKGNNIHVTEDMSR